MQSSGTLLPFDHFDRAQGKLAQDSAQGDTLMCHPESFNKKFVLIEKDELSSRVPRLCRGVSRDTLFEFISSSGSFARGELPKCIEGYIIRVH